MRLLILFFCGFCMITSCKETVKEVTIDNPSDTPVVVKFENMDPVRIPALGKVSTAVTFGKQMIQVDDQEPVEVFLDEEFDYLINPTLSQYYIENVLYIIAGYGRKNYEKDYGTSRKSMIGRIEVEGDFEKIEPALLIRKRWLFDLDVAPTMQVQTNRDMARGYKIVKRIVREKDIRSEMVDYLFRNLLSDEEETSEKKDSE